MPPLKSGIRRFPGVRTLVIDWLTVETKRQRVLLVEDNPADAALIEGMFERQGTMPLDLVRADSLGKALDRIAHEAFDAVLLDLTLPDSCGIATLERLQIAAQDVPIVILTGVDDEELALRAIRQGAQDYLFKGAMDGHALTRSVCYAIDRKRAEQALREAHRRAAWLALVIEESPDPILRVAAEGVILYRNPAAMALPGWAGEVGQPLSPPLWPLARQAIDKGQRMQQDVELNGRTYSVWIMPIPKESYANVYGRDITDHKRAEEESARLEAQTRQLQKAESLGRMAGAIAHHFNNQLQAIMANLESAIGDLPQGSKTIETLTEAMQGARQAAEVSTRMLTYLGQTTGSTAPLDLSEICRQSLPMLQVAMPVDLKTEFAAPGPIISAKADQIRQVLTNLVANAWEAGGASRGAIRITVTTVSSADIPTSCRFPVEWQPHDKAYACLEVADAGCGIAEKDLDKLFDPFFSTKFSGRGLGLAVVLGIVRAHGGAVTVQSAMGRGSVFRVFLPASAEAVPQPPVKAAQAPRLEAGGTVLLVDDAPSIRKAMTAALTQLGFAVLSAKDGVEALEVFREHSVDIRCVLCDLTMPRMDGWETLAALRQLAPELPVILSSGYDEDQVMAGDHPERPSAFLPKPYLIKELREALGHALNDRKK